MRKQLLSGLVSLGLLFGTAAPSFAAHARTHQQYVRHKRHVNTVKRVVIGSAGGAAIGALAGGGPGAGIGAIAGAGAGALYDAHRKHHGHN
jgi:outer membrane lipoprotein SlyB